MCVIAPSKRLATRAPPHSSRKSRARTVQIIPCVSDTHESSPVDSLGKRRIRRNFEVITGTSPVHLWTTSGYSSLVSLGLLALAGGNQKSNSAALLRSRFFPPEATLARDRLVSKYFSFSIQLRAFQATHLSTPIRSRNVRTCGCTVPIRHSLRSSATAAACPAPTSNSAHP